MLEGLNVLGHPWRLSPSLLRSRCGQPCCVVERDGAAWRRLVAARARASRPGISHARARCGETSHVQFAGCAARRRRGSEDGPRTRPEEPWPSSVNVQFRKHDEGICTFRQWHVIPASIDGVGMAKVMEGAAGFWRCPTRPDPGEDVLQRKCGGPPRWRCQPASPQGGRWD